MHKLIAFAGVFTIFSLSPALAATVTDAECAAEWKKADVNADGFVSETEGSRYYATLRVANTPVANGKMDQTLFLQNCKTGAFIKANLQPGTPMKGSNSFTEGQAKDRIIAAGMTSVSALKKDDDGIWRGTANDGTKVVNIAVDFKGNVVAN